MEFKFDVNQLVDKLCRAERVIGEQGFTISKLDAEMVTLNIELAKAKKEIDALQESCKNADESVKFWYAKAIELGYKLDWSENLVPANESEDFAHGA